jgi:two-component system alkaline phosphatase synthesis response regulator PhoP
MARAEDKTILVVDDEPNVREYLAALLEDAGFKVITAADGEEALALIKGRKPDFISLDLIMPRKSGHKLLYELRKDRELSRIPVLIVTAHAKTDLGKHDLQDILESSVMSGPGTYLEKPVDPRNYVRSVQRALGVEVTPEITEKAGLRDEVEQSLRGATAEQLRSALAALKKAQKG